jgi:Domain of unknown function (DUF1963)
VWSTCDELEAALGQAGLGDWASRLAGAARHTMILETGPVEEGAQARVGASRLGGMPDLPPDVPWPWRPPVSERVWKAHAERPWPLSFVAQIDFAEIQSAGGLEGFPTSGRLLLFYDPICWPDGETAEDQKRASVMFVSEPHGSPGAARISCGVRQSTGRADHDQRPRLRAAPHHTEALAPAATAMLQ